MDDFLFFAGVSLVIFAWFGGNALVCKYKNKK